MANWFQNFLLVILILTGTPLNNIALASSPEIQPKTQPQTQPQTQPNILWIYVEDMNDWMGCYGETLIKTPHIDALAKEGIRFDRVYMPSPVCSATRSALITGTMSTTLGLHNHRSSRNSWNIYLKNGKRIKASMGENYDAIHLPKHVQTIPELFRAAGYYTFNKGKEDYNFVHNVSDLYDNKKTIKGNPARWMGFAGAKNGTEWSGRKQGQPFFGQIQLSGGKHKIKKKTGLVDRAKVVLPPYYPDHPTVREEYAHHYDCILKTDEEVGEIMAALKRDQLLENTIVFFFTDHGFRMMRHKQFCYEGGIKVPLIVSWKGNAQTIPSGTVRDDLVSGIDISTSSLALAGLKIPSHMEGIDLFANKFTPRPFVITTRDRLDYTIDRIRAVDQKRFKYIRNELTDRPWMQPNYRDPWEVTIALKRLYKEGKMNPIQARFFGTSRPKEELYDLKNDPHEIHNLANTPQHQNKLKEMRTLLDNWIKKTGDQGQKPESDAGLRSVLKRWGKRCVNPEYDRVRKQ